MVPIIGTTIPLINTFITWSIKYFQIASFQDIFNMGISWIDIIIKNDTVYFRISKSAPVLYYFASSRRKDTSLTWTSVFLFCLSRFCVGDKFFLKNNMILCQTDYEEGLMKEGYAPQVRWAPLLAALCTPGEELREDLKGTCNQTQSTSVLSSPWPQSTVYMKTLDKGKNCTD